MAIGVRPLVPPPSLLLSFTWGVGAAQPTFRFFSRESCSICSCRRDVYVTVLDWNLLNKIFLNVLCSTAVVSFSRKLRPKVGQKIVVQHGGIGIKILASWFTSQRPILLVFWITLSRTFHVNFRISLSISKIVGVLIAMNLTIDQFETSYPDNTESSNPWMCYISLMICLLS